MRNCVGQHGGSFALREKAYEFPLKGLSCDIVYNASYEDDCCEYNEYDCSRHMRDLNDDDVL